MPDLHMQKWHWRPADVQQHSSFCYPTLGAHCHLGSNIPLTSKYKTHAYFGRTALQKASIKSATQGIRLIKWVQAKLVNSFLSNSGVYCICKISCTRVPLMKHICMPPF